MLSYKTPLMIDAQAGKKRVVVTGMGVVSSLGNDPNTFFDNLCAGKSGIRQIEAFECADWSTRIAGEVPGFRSGRSGVEKDGAAAGSQHHVLARRWQEGAARRGTANPHQVRPRLR